jgi:hypothetical protein
LVTVEVAVVTSAVSAAVDFTAAAAFMAVASAAVDFAAAAFMAAGFAAVDFTEIDFTMATSTIGFSSLMALETHSFTIPIHITGITPTAIIHMTTILTAMDTVVFGAATLATLVFAGMAFMAVDFTAVALTAVPREPEGDSFNESGYRNSAYYSKADACC